MRGFIFGTAALLAVSAGAAFAQGEKGRWWPVQNISGCSIWNPHPRAGEAATWSGTCSNGKAEGPGTAIWHYVEDGKRHEDRTTGTLAAGKFVGPRVIHFEDGTRFEGDPSGRGVLKFADGARYEGEFRDGRFHGRGAFTRADGSGFEGELRDGQLSGHGILKFANGSRYEGQFRDGAPLGPGICTLGGRTGHCLIENRKVRWLD